MLLSVWNLSDFWKSVERASICLMIFLAVAMLFLPLVQPKEAEAVNPLVIKLIEIGGALVVGAAAGFLAAHLSKNECSGCDKKIAQGESHWTTCSTCGYGYYSCRERHRIYCSEHYQWRKPCEHDCTPDNSN